MMRQMQSNRVSRTDREGGGDALFYKHEAPCPHIAVVDFDPMNAWNAIGGERVW